MERDQRMREALNVHTARSRRGPRGASLTSHHVEQVVPSSSLGRIKGLHVPLVPIETLDKQLGAETLPSGQAATTTSSVGKSTLRRFTGKKIGHWRKRLIHGARLGDMIRPRRAHSFAGESVIGEYRVQALRELADDLNVRVTAPQKANSIRALRSMRTEGVGKGSHQRLSEWFMAPRGAERCPAGAGTRAVRPAPRTAAGRDRGGSGPATPPRRR